MIDTWNLEATKLDLNYCYPTILWCIGKEISENGGLPDEIVRYIEGGLGSAIECSVGFVASSGFIKSAITENSDTKSWYNKVDYICFEYPYLYQTKSLLRSRKAQDSNESLKGRGQVLKKTIKGENKR
jgi:hypothetical protein